MGALVGEGATAGDVIVAPATPPGISALAVVRLTGPEGETLRVSRAFAPTLPERPVPRQLQRVRLVDASGRGFDEATAIFFAAPRSATGEEVVEVICHGAPAVVSALLESACAAGARPARNGEFTRRALANGKVDLAEAEGVGYLGRSESRGAARRGLGLVEGALSGRVRALRERLLDLLALLEAGLDFAEDVSPLASAERAERLLRLDEETRSLAGPSRASAPERVPVVALVGAPNAGKSTLFNALLGIDRSIVTEVPGTTRDAVSETLEIGGERVRLVDTAGLRETQDRVERIGVDVARRAASGADLVLFLVDGSAGEASEGAPEGAVVVATKVDLPARRGVSGAVAVSALTGEGLDRLRELVAERLALTVADDELVHLARHREALVRAAAHAAEARAQGLAGAGDEIVAGELRGALSALGEITGETATEELLDRIFSTFCLGK